MRWGPSVGSGAGAVNVGLPVVGNAGGTFLRRLVSMNIFPPSVTAPEPASSPTSSSSSSLPSVSSSSATTSSPLTRLATFEISTAPNTASSNNVSPASALLSFFIAAVAWISSATATTVSTMPEPALILSISTSPGIDASMPRKAPTGSARYGYSGLGGSARSGAS